MDNPIMLLAVLGAAAGTVIGALLKQIRDDTRQLADLNFRVAEADEPDDDWTAKAEAAAARKTSQRPKPTSP